MSKDKRLKTNAKINIDHIAKLANLPLSGKEKSTYGQQLAKILEYVEQLESVDTKNVESTFNVSPNKNLTRVDKVNKGLTQDEALSNVNQKKDGFVVTKGVFEE